MGVGVVKEQVHDVNNEAGDEEHLTEASKHEKQLCPHLNVSPPLEFGHLFCRFSGSEEKTKAVGEIYISNLTSWSSRCWARILLLLLLLL